MSLSMPGSAWVNQVLAVPACNTQNKDKPVSLQLSSCDNWGRAPELREAQWILSSAVFPQVFMYEFLRHSDTGVKRKRSNNCDTHRPGKTQQK